MQNIWDIYQVFHIFVTSQDIVEYWWIVLGGDKDYGLLDLIDTDSNRAVGLIYLNPSYLLIISFLIVEKLRMNDASADHESAA